VSLARDAWKLLRGVSCIYKPSDCETLSIVDKFTESVTRDLNSMRTTSSWPPDHSHNALVPGNSGKYSDHPLVIGQGFEPEDLKMEPIVINSYRMSGLTLVGVNDPKLARKWRSHLSVAAVPSTYRVTFRFGKSTDTLFTDGKTTELSTTKHLVNKPQKLLGYLQRIQRGHQRVMLKGIKMQSQEAYDLAVSGRLTRHIGQQGTPADAAGNLPADNLPPADHGLVLNFSLVEYKVPEEVVLDVTAVNADESFLSELIDTVGYKLKTNAVTESIRRMRIGVGSTGFQLSLKDCLQERHWSSAQHVIDNILNVERKTQDYQPFKVTAS